MTNKAAVQNALQHAASFDEENAWQELAAHVRAFQRAENIAAGFLYLCMMLMLFFSRKVPEIVLLIIPVLGSFFFILRKAARIANKYRCPHCGLEFMHIEATAKNSMAKVCISDYYAKCQHCDEMIRNPNGKPGRPFR